MNSTYATFKELTEELPKRRDRIVRDAMIAAAKCQPTEKLMKALDDLNWLERKELGRAVESLREPVIHHRTPWSNQKK